jgi:DNA-binding NarL/FixJ family response regulator
VAEALDPRWGAAAEAGVALTPREREILLLLAEGQTHRAVSETLFIGERTVESHVVRLFRKLGAHSRAEAIAAARAAGLVAPPTDAPAPPA